MNKKPHIRHLVIVLILVFVVHLLIISPFCIDYIQTSIAQMQEQELYDALQQPLAPQPPAQVVMVPATYMPTAGVPGGAQGPINLLAQPSALGPNKSGVQSGQENPEPLASKPQESQQVALSAPERVQALEPEESTLDESVSTEQMIEEVNDRISPITALAIERIKKQKQCQALRELTAKERVMKRGAESTQPSSIMPHQQAQKAKPTLAEISQGYMQSVQEQKVATAAQAGNGGLGHGVQIACKRYEDKIWALIEQAIRMHRDQLYSDREIEMNTALIITVAKNGSLIETHLSNKTGNASMDNYLLSKAKQAGLFPPIPDSLKQDTITTQANFRITLKKGMNSLDFIMYAPQGV